MTKYALPAILGGQEMDGEAHGDGVILDVPGYGNLLMPAHYVTEVPPEVPPEDPTGTVWCNGVDVWIRHDVVGARDDGGHWWGTDTGRLHGYRLWKEVAPIVAGPGWHRWAPVEDVPQRADEVPALPLEIRDREGFVAFRVDFAPDARPYPAGWVHAGNSAVELSAPELEQAAAAMLLAARMCREAKR